MIRIFYREGLIIRSYQCKELKPVEDKSPILWIDVYNPSQEEINWVVENFNIEFPSIQEREDIEISSRYWEEEDSVTINTFFLIREGENAFNETVSFIIKNNYIITVRYRELKTFSEFARRLMTNPSVYKTGYHIFSSILEIKIASDSDVLENVSKEISKLGKVVSSGNLDVTETVFESISYYEDLNMTIRESLIDKQRVLSSLLKSYKLPPDVREEIRILIKDVNSLIDYTKFNFERLNYLQNTFLGLLNIEQNKVIKIFTVIATIFIPPTLIASIYGMNFENMPELHWKYGYYFSLLLMVLTATVPLYFFKKRGWL
ncbi:magnesium and cobalt transport protein CorA [Sulfurihydrogenibium azorense Az-Fu1]|jgi:magnesium transporter|uniref:Magnesium transport protein CorA n=1 Tax=Sulfurihydrogenibium azorense (strain DSM 15241 / OCM 825 / Az-Fu1) TaxID=204536 RepID=C1DVI4_SULAA|nr:magnesium/cobalt transporter CorA [Sulfurihydrogenibium azorense]ACN99659.1 magnesium and cobalt transport protein CorA [Sulfurihydrogenibium azorense Az-Fu1]